MRDSLHAAKGVMCGKRTGGETGRDSPRRFASVFVK